MSENATPEIDIEEFAAARGVGLLLDVREPDEYARGHVPGAVLIPMGQLANRVDEIDKTTPVFVICASGNRSSAMTDLLRDAGYRRLLRGRRHWRLGTLRPPPRGRTGMTSTDTDHRPHRDPDPGRPQLRGPRRRGRLRRRPTT